jgi:hypothetical protein
MLALGLLLEGQMPRGSDFADRHRAVYTLERSVWKARCRICGCEVTDPDRRQAAALFRQHIRESRTTVVVAQRPVIDLTRLETLSDVEPV